VVGLYIQVALSSAHTSERLKALLRLRRLPQDTRARAALELILRTETDPRLRSYAHHALKHQDPSYKAAWDAQARRSGDGRRKAQGTSAKRRYAKGLSEPLLLSPRGT
jgi:hypothetical protein